MSTVPYRILVTGANGNVGAETITALVAAASLPAGRRHPRGNALEIRAAVRDCSRYTAASPLVQPVCFDFHDATTWDAALDGVDALFLMRPPAIADIDRTIGPFIDRAAARPGLKIVFLSLIGVERMPYVPHYKAGARITASGAPYVFLRPSFFMQNLSTTHRKEIAEDGEIFVPAGSGKTNFIDVHDIGEAWLRP